ncbi:hypothetical protein [Hymenobacter jeollabukensis]|uniref:Uncharacterized protein n=1 Tax=Hymenobacter jeollabukensis TaxID=2025313 RepID=A0A5R8WP18_9BACT|nr:hypothetical protein [Hymenobacter jeollabukensis]TLM91779.1 hypothetical protein FDY95_14560 [Hymenobacter jeollabukensis]
MKTSLLAACFCLLMPAFALAQQAPHSGYWNLETNLSTRDYTIVRFYNDQDELLREERLDALCLNLSQGTPLCRRTARLLNTTLAQVLHDPASPTQLAAQLGQNRRIQRVYAVR